MAYWNRYSIWEKPALAGFVPSSLPAAYVIGRDGKVKFARNCQSRFDLMSSDDAIEMIKNLLNE